MDDFWKLSQELEITLRHQDGWGYKLSEEEEGIIKLETKNNGIDAEITFPREVAKQLAETICKFVEEI